MHGLFLCKCGHPDIAPAVDPNHMGTETKSFRLDQLMSNSAISQANCEGQVNLKSRWLRMS